MPTPETDLQVAQRHVREAKARLGRLEEIALQFGSRRQSTILVTVLIETMRDSIRLAEDHVTRLESREASH